MDGQREQVLGQLSYQIGSGVVRGADGRLGVRTGGGGGAVNVTMNISTPDVAGFQRSQSQIAAEMNRAMKRGRRNL